ncbi:MAG: DUF4384 domain-containing protein [Burkholderiaceae bacterium]
MSPKPNQSKSIRRPERFLRRALLSLTCLAVLGGCATANELTDYDETVRAKAKVQRNPKDLPSLNSTGFKSALRCMDYLMISYGVKNLSILVEDITDATRKVSAGPKDMIISAVSQMSRRSRAIQLVAYSINDQTLGAIIGLGTRDRLIENAPDFTIRGSVSQFDDSVVKKQGEAGLNIGAVTLGGALQGSADILGLDLSVIETTSLLLVPGATSTNSMQVVNKGGGGDGEVNTRKLGLNFNFVLAESEGRSQALRTLIELATIELIGKLTKIPYWTCLGAPAESNEVAFEISDWWETLAGDIESLVAYFQQQMIARGLYEGAINGIIDDSLIHSVTVYKQAMGLTPDESLNLEFFKQYLATDHVATEKVALDIKAGNPGPAPAVAASGDEKNAAVVAAVGAAGAASGAQATSAEPVFVYVSGVQGPQTVHRPGQPFAVDVAVDQDTNLYCYLVDENKAVNQFFPNALQPQPLVRAGTRMQFPGEFPFNLVTSRRGITETVACYGSPKALGAEPLKGLKTVPTTEALTNAFSRAAGTNIGSGVYDVVTQ